MNYLLLQFVNQTIFFFFLPSIDRHKYYDFLQVANEGDTRPFIRFIADCTEKTLDLFLWATSELSHQVPLLSDPDEHGRNILYDHILDNDEASGDRIPSTHQSKD